MSEKLAFKWVMVWIASVWFDLVWILWSGWLDCVRRSSVHNLTAIGGEMDEL